MAKGRDKHQAYLDALNLLGKDLARRAKSKCELLEESDELRPYDLSAGEKEPSLDHVVLICAKAREAIEGKVRSPNDFRALESIVWSDLLPIRQAASRILEKIDDDWAREALENAKTMGLE